MENNFEPSEEFKTQIERILSNPNKVRKPELAAIIFAEVKVELIQQELNRLKKEQKRLGGLFEKTDTEPAEIN